MIVVFLSSLRTEKYNGEIVCEPMILIIRKTVRKKTLKKRIGDFIMLKWWYNEADTFFFTVLGLFFEAYFFILEL
ncbi:hypothetical protein GW853_03215 [Candidatus Kuenenbacteria bacterium]|nr:hypothetical protein [Candidatus Kuenenbacteria bacterium]